MPKLLCQSVLTELDSVRTNRTRRWPTSPAPARHLATVHRWEAVCPGERLQEHHQLPFLASHAISLPPSRSPRAEKPSAVVAVSSGELAREPHRTTTTQTSPTAPP
jgi:hypothetical protein